jgi:putative FmdB family regulatory protein
LAVRSCQKHIHLKNPLKTMPIYAYKCESCGHAKDVLQKMSDATLVDCPACSASSFKKQLTSAGFQLKGSGWYVTDFRDAKGAGDKAKDAEKSQPSDSPAKADAPASSGSDATTAATKTVAAAAAPVAASPAPAPKAAP